MSPSRNVRASRKRKQTRQLSERKSGGQEYGREHGLIQVPGIGRRSQTHADWTPDACGLVAESAEPEDPATAFPPVQSDGPGARLSQGIQEPRLGCRDQGPTRLDDEVAGVVAGRLWPLWAAFHSDGVAQRRFVPHRRRPRRGSLRRTTFCAPK